MNANDNVVGSPLIVCTAHIHWDPEFCDVKLVQCMMFASELQHLLSEVMFIRRQKIATFQIQKVQAEARERYREYPFLLFS